jgi:release factor glutamine methyltransferase
MSTYRELLQTAREILKQHEIADADVDAWYLLVHVFGIKRTDFLLHGDHVVAESEGKRFLSLIKERAAHIPLQHITGTQEFMGLEFEVNEDVLIPRQDTETLVEEVLKECNGKSVLDMCTGSGCIIISLAKLGRLQRAVGVDISEKALLIASKNAERHKVEIEYIQSDLFGKLDGSYDIIVSNPPYIPTGEIGALMPEVKDHDPLLALDGTEDGLEFYRRIISEAKNFLTQNGWIFFEIGHEQGADVKQLLDKEGFMEIRIKKDLSGHDRVVTARRCPDT